MLVVELDMDTMEPVVAYQFPPPAPDTAAPPDVCAFCFPEEDDFRQSRLIKEYVAPLFLWPLSPRCSTSMYSNTAQRNILVHADCIGCARHEAVRLLPQIHGLGNSVLLLRPEP